MINIASIQIKISDEAKELNLKRVSELIDSVDGADLILLPELWNIGYFGFTLYRDECEDLNGPTITLLKEKAAQKGCYIFGGSLVMRSEDGGLYNTSTLINPKGDIIAQYRKMHLLDTTRKKQSS